MRGAFDDAAPRRCRELGDLWIIRGHHDAVDLFRLYGRVQRVAHQRPTQQRCHVLECLAYLQRNQHRMLYLDFHRQGLCTSTGVVEAGCKNVIGARLKRSGMRWSVRGANAIIALRCARLSRNRFEDFWERRTAE